MYRGTFDCLFKLVKNDGVCIIAGILCKRALFICLGEKPVQRYELPPTWCSRNQCNNFWSVWQCTTTYAKPRVNILNYSCRSFSWTYTGPTEYQIIIGI